MKALLLLRRLLEQAGGADESGYVLVLEGEWLDELPSEMVTGQGTYAVHRATTEIGLRHLLWKAQGAPLLVVLPEELAQRLQKAPDLLRGGRNQRVHALAPNDVLEVLLGVRVVGADQGHLQDLAIHYVDQLSLAMGQRTLPTVVDRRLLTELLLDVSVGDEVRSRDPASLLASWLQQPPAWSHGVLQLVCEALPTLHGDAGKVLGWALKDGERRLRELVVHGAVLTVEAEELPKKVWGPLWQAARDLELDPRLLRRTVTTLVEGALGEPGNGTSSPAWAVPLLTEADKLGRESLKGSELQTSCVLPLAFADRCHSLAQRARDGKVIGGDAIVWLERHRAAMMNRADLAVIKAMARLTRYLDAPEAAGDDVVDQVRGYQQHGAFADLAAMQLVRALASSVAYGKQAEALLARVRSRRDRDNRRFAEALAAGYEAALHRPKLTPLHRLWKWEVAPRWRELAGTKLYLVVLDGCSYPVYLELLYALTRDKALVIGARPDAEGRTLGLQALSPLPTVTSHARGAIFLGELPQDPLVAEALFREQEEGKTDPPRFKQNEALGGRSRQLFLKRDLADGGAGLIAALKDERIDVVAVVFNAVDDQIGSANTGATVRLAPEDIKGFKPSLAAALDAGREVLLTADHGFSPFLSTALRAKPTGGASVLGSRVLALGEAKDVPEGFVEIDVASLGGPPQRRAFAWRTGAYLGKPQVGFHGGCSLEEMAVPLAWLTKDGYPAQEPAWWHGQARLEPLAALRPALPPLAPPPPSEPPTPTKGQISLLDPADKAEVLALPAAVLAAFSREERAVLVLLKENGQVRASDLAQRLRKNPGRLNGLLRVLARKLHKKGLALYSAEGLPDGETQYRWEGSL